MVQKVIPFQFDQCEKIFRILGSPRRERWPGLEHMPDYSKISGMATYKADLYSFAQSNFTDKGERVNDLMRKMLEYDPEKRISAIEV
jgi:serine/threonine protein kinase